MWKLVDGERWLVIIFSTILICLIATISIWLKVPIRSWYRTIRLALQLKGPPALPLLGNILMLRDSPAMLRLAVTAFEKYGSLCRVWLTGMPFIILFDPKYLKVILNSSRLSDKNFLYSFSHEFLGRGMITTNGHKWKSHRKYISPYFKINYLKQFIQTFDKCACSLAEEFKGKNQVQITSFINRCILNIVHKAIMGIPLEEQDTISRSPFTKGPVSLIQRVIRPWLLLNSIYRFTTNSKLEHGYMSALKQFSSEVLAKRRKERRELKNLEWCLLDGFIEISETEPDFTDEDILDEIGTFMLVGQHSVCAATAFTLHYLAKYQDIQNKVIEEIRKVTFKNNVTLERLDEMKYLERCIYESLRICPSAPMISRKLCEDVKLGEHVLPEGCNILISSFVTHRSPQHFPEPEIFDPERFCTKFENCAYIPFSAGPRDCMGKKFAILEIKTIILRLLQNYKISLVPGKEHLQLEYLISLRAKGGILLKLESR